MIPTARPLQDDEALLAFFQVIAAGDLAEASRMLDASGDGSARRAIQIGGSRQNAVTYFLDAVQHQLYLGDTGLHIAAAAYRQNMAALLVAKGAELRARNRRGAEPLHYAADGNPLDPRWDPDAQREVIAYLVAHGADPNARNNSGTAPLHRAVRSRCAAAVQSLLDNGADPRMTNGNGSTPLDIAGRTTGRGGSGTAAAREQQATIIEYLLEHGARPTDTDANGRSVSAAAD